MMGYGLLLVPQIAVDSLIGVMIASLWEKLK
jgi:hypothetical protein